MGKKSDKKRALNSIPAPTPEGRRNQMISLAEELAERQLLEGTASSQVITHFLKLASEREKAEVEKIKRQNKLLEAQAESIRRDEQNKIDYKKAVEALKSYGGTSNNEEYDEWYDNDY